MYRFSYGRDYPARDCAQTAGGPGGPGSGVRFAVATGSSALMNRSDGGVDGRGETPRERADRNLAELNGELRVVITGIQVLFAFLLVAPFDTGFTGLDRLERGVYFVTLILAGLSAVLTMAPSAWHRILFRHDDKPELVRAANRSVVAGLGCLALAMCGSLLLVSSKLFGTSVGGVTAVIAAAVFGSFWFGLPLLRRAQIERSARAGRAVRRGDSAGDRPRDANTGTPA